MCKRRGNGKLNESTKNRELDANLNNPHVLLHLIDRDQMSVPLTVGHHYYC